MSRGAIVELWLRPARMLVVGLMVAGCSGGEAPDAMADAEGGADAAAAGPTLVYGEAHPLGNGTMRTYVVIGEDGPTEVGVALSESALEGLPADGAEGGVLMPDGHSTFPMPIPMPSDNPTPFVQAVVDWNPMGHELPGVYDIPHFDFHFYTVGQDVVMSIDPADPEFMTKGVNAPPATHVPAGYVMPPDLLPVPFMGAHWVDPMSPELRTESPETFTHTFIYGSWNGQMIFAEPMITVAFLQSRQPVHQPVAVAEVYEPAGYYPTAYGVHFDEDAAEYRISLSDLAMMD